MLAKIKVYAVIQSKLQKQTPKIFKTGGRTPGAPVLDPYIIKYKINLFFNPRKSIDQYE